ncbi:hypothetical protein AB0M42_12930 [Streptomyces sp. NPDC051784]|uniref:hypothetical protein n=1 Tax=Streptomyces sp. NPDC051784 TaxID=3155805 RepID=UPI0034489A86
MSTDSGDAPHETHAALLARIDGLLALPFPVGEESSDDEGRSSGPGHHLLILRAGEDFWDDRSPETVEPAEQEIEADFSALATALGERWGEPRTVDLWPWLEEDEEGGDTVPEPMGQLCNLAGSMQVWQPPGGTRWLGLTVGQADPEFPIWLLAAVGEAAILPA